MEIFFVDTIVGSEKGTDYADGSQTATVGNVTFKVTYTKDAKLPKDAKLVVSKVKDTDDYVEAAEDKLGTDEFNGKFYDIHFEVDGKEYPVSADTNVKITLSGNDALDADANVKVLHFEDDSMKPEVIGDVEVSGGKQEEKADKPSVVTFTTDGFSVYAITETTDTSKTKEYRRTYTFQNDDGSEYEFTLNDNPKDSDNETQTGTKTSQQIVRNRGTLLDVGTPTSKNGGKNFLGWGVVTGTGNNATVDTTNLINLPTTITGLTSDDSVTLRAVFGNDYTITFHDDNGNIIQTKTVKRTETSNVNISDITTEKAGDYALVGWSAEKNATEATYTDSIASVTSDMDLYPVFAAAHAITFNSNDGGDGSATVISSQRYTTGQTTTAPTQNPQRQGYTFDGWYTDQACTTAFSWENELTDNITLYAKWNPTETTYTVVIWRQQIGDDKSATAAQKTYDYAESHTINANTGDQIDGSTSALSAYENYSTGDYKGFRYASAGVSRTDSTTNVTVKGDGSTIINVYYDRQLITMNFSGTGYTYTESYSGNYGLVDGQYVRLYNSSMNNPSWNDTAWYYSSGWHQYSGTRYSRQQSAGTTTTFTGLYGQPLSMYNYTWPEGTWQYTGTDGTIYGMSYLGQFVLPDDTAAAGASVGTEINFTRTGEAGVTVYFYLQNTDGSWPTTYSDRGYLESNGEFYFSEKYDNFNVSYYMLDDDGTGQETSGYYGRSWERASTSGNNSSVGLSGHSTLGVRYSRKSYNVEFYNGSTHLNADQSKLYEASLSGITVPTAGTDFTYPGNSDVAGHYVFIGWFADPELTTYVSFGTALSAEQQASLQAQYPSITNFVTYETMPGHNLPVYAGWKPVRLTVTLDVNGGNLPENLGVTLDNNNSFTVDYGDFVPSSIQNSTRDGYELMGWYVTNSDGSLGDPWVFGSPVTQNIKLTARWRSTSTIKVVYNAVQGTGIAAITGTNAPTDNNSYIDGGSAITAAAPTAPDGYEFVGWSLDGKTYKPGDTFTIDASLAGEADENNVRIITLTAVYTKIDTTYIHYNINYEGGTGTLTDPSGIDNNYQKNIPLNQTTILSNGTGFTRTGYKLVGWNTQADGNGTHWALGETVGVDDQPSTELYAEWEPVASIVIKKTDETGTKALTGAEFTFEKKNGETWTAVNNFNSDSPLNVNSENGVQIDDLDDGEYRLTEIKAPDGYIINARATTFTITDGVVRIGDNTAATQLSGERTVYVISITNTAGTALPNTGGSGTTMYTLGGLTLIIASALMYGFVLRQKNRERRFK